MANVITIKRRRNKKISRGARGEGIIRIDSEATDVLEQLLEQAGGEIPVKDLASALIRYAANDTIIKVEDGEV